MHELWDVMAQTGGSLVVLSEWVLSFQQLHVSRTGVVLRFGVWQGEGVRFLSIELGTEQVTQEIFFDCLIAVLDKFWWEVWLFWITFCRSPRNLSMYDTSQYSGLKTQALILNFKEVLWKSSFLFWLFWNTSYKNLSTWPLAPWVCFCSKQLLGDCEPDNSFPGQVEILKRMFEAGFRNLKNG